MTPPGIEGPLTGQASVCSPILRALPEWFGIETALQQYERDIEALPTFLARAGEDVIGFLTVRRHFPAAAEILVMGVVPAAQGRGIGRALVAAAEAHLRLQGIEYLQVKTLGPSNPDPGYARTRAFYESLGFRPLEELKQIWDETNPCLILVKRL
jgi:ribosomal protein S18 acetylase RimI-like enzyme